MLAIPMAAGLSPSATGEEHRPLVGQLGARRRLGLGERGREVGGDAHHLAGGAHLRAQQGVGPGEAAERQHRLLDADVPAPRRGGQAEIGDLLPQQDPAGELGQRQPDRLGDERDRARGAGVGLDDVQPVVAANRELDVEQPDDAECLGDPGGLLADAVEHLPAQRVGRQHARRVPGVDPGLLDVLHDPGDPDGLAVAQGVDVDLDRVLQEAVEVDGGAGLGRRPGPGSRAGPRRRRRSPWHGRRARSWGARAAGSRRRARPPAPPRRWSRWRRAARCSPGGPAAPRSASDPRPGRWRRCSCPGSVTPAASRPAASLSGVWPPNWTTTPSGCSSSQTASTSSSVSGSKYSRSDVS